jgi:phage terminase large subunit-like protein
MGKREIMEEIAILEEIKKRKRYSLIDSYFPDSGPLRRELYVKHMEFFRLGATKRQRCVMAANRVGKTETMGGYEMVCHLTGVYPAWWKGRRFGRPISAWAAGDTSKTVRDIIQKKLFGDISDIGSGLIKKDLVNSITRKPGTQDAIEFARIKHLRGGESVLNLKSYDQRRISFQGTEQDVIWLDEEPEHEIYNECLLRTMTNNGIIIATFTPLKGKSRVVLAFEEADENNRNDVGLINATWDDAPHLDKSAIEDMLASCSPHERDARSRGVPSLGSGAVYPVAESSFVEDDFVISDDWPRAYGLDVGWQATACVWGAINPVDRSMHIYSEYKQGGLEPYGHAQSIVARGKGVSGVVDPASRGRSQVDGRSLIDLYRGFGLDLQPADNRVETGIFQVYQDLSNGQIKIFRSCINLLKEFRSYQRDERGNIKKENDHLMDALRYLRMSGKDNARKSYVKADFGWMSGSFN